jgi:hypothetical protein
MGREQEMPDAKAILFKRLYGLKFDNFEKRLSLLRRKYDRLLQKGGKSPNNGRGQVVYCPEILTEVLDNL